MPPELQPIKEMKSALLVHLLLWESKEESFGLGDGISLWNVDGTQVESLYLQLCESDNLDQGEPFSYTSFILMQGEAHDETWPYWGGPFSVISQVCNAIVICTSTPLGMCRLLTTKDDFRTLWTPSDVIYEMNPGHDFLAAAPSDFHLTGDSISVSNVRFPRLNDATLEEIRSLWDTSKRLHSSSEIDTHRISNAIGYFFYAWRSYYLEHICLNLSIALESLFSPSSQHELAHQISFNVSRFLCDSRVEREEIYGIIKRFYGIRSRIVHGSKVSDNALYVLVPTVFHLCSRILKKILLDHDLAVRFCKKNEMRELVDDWVFGE